MSAPPSPKLQPTGMENAQMMYWQEIDSPVGPLLLAGDGEALRLVYFQAGPHPRRPPSDWIADAMPVSAAIRQLEEYFAGERRAFDLPLAPQGTDFQRTVWRELTRIPYGQTVSYGELARRVGNPQASRAVGLANGKNPLPIIVPCHRVIGANGSLTGFGGGVEIKRKLLTLESANAGAAPNGTQMSLLGEAYRLPRPTP